MIQRTTTTSVSLKVTGMHCASCGLLVDDVLEDLPGVRRAQTDSKRGRTTVEFDPSTTPLAEIVRTIAGLGYEVEEATS